MPTWSTIPWRRSHSPAKRARRQVIQRHGVVLDGARRCVQVDGYVVHLTARETAVLAVLMDRAGRVVYRPALAAAAWATTEASSGALDRLMSRLRRRIEPSPLSPRRLRRVGDAGYLFGAPPELPGKPRQ